jgi:hypothetical protein
MDGVTFPFVAGCIFFGVGALLILSLLQYAWQRRGMPGRATGSIVAIDISSAAEGRQTIARAADAPASNAASQRFYRVVVAYEVDGQQFEVRGPFSMQPSTTRTTYAGAAGTSKTEFGPLRYDVGDKMSVAYDRTNPAHAIVMDRTRDWTVFALQIFCGLMSIAVGLLAFYANGNLAWVGPAWQHH